MPARDETARPWIVAVGASAGGLEPLQRFFAGMSSPSHAAFVVIQHLAPDHRSMMAELLGRHAQLPVREALAGECLLADHIYLMPAGVLMTIEQEQLVFAPRPLQGVPLPIDRFFSSLATSGAERAIGVVLSGSGSDGAVGAAALRAAGGFVMAQSPETARFDSMPRSLIAATVVDAVLAPEGLASQVLALTQGRAGRLAAGELLSAASVKPALQRLFDALLDLAGLDFGQYKLPTVMRRIERRMRRAGLRLAERLRRPRGRLPGRVRGPAPRAADPGDWLLPRPRGLRRLVPGASRPDPQPAAGSASAAVERRLCHG